MSVGLDLLNLIMADNNFFNKITDSIEADTSSTDFLKTSLDHKDFRQLSQMLEKSLTLQTYNCGTNGFKSEDTNGTSDDSIDGTNGTSFEPSVKPKSRLDPLAKEYEVRYSRSLNGWNSNNRWSNRWSPQQTIDSKTKEGMRPIIKTPNEKTKGELAQRNSNGISGNDWYNTFVEQTQRFAQMNGKFDDYSDRKRVRFQETSDYWDTGTDDSILETSDGSPIETAFGSQSDYDFDFKHNNRTEFPERKSRNVEQTSDQYYSFPKLDIKGSIVESLYNGVFKPAANNLHKEWIYGQNQWNKNMAHIRNTLNNSVLFGDSIWANPSDTNNSYNRFYSDSEAEGKMKIQNLLNQMKKTIPRSSANYTWSGQLPRKLRTKNQVFSTKVFLGGIPYDLTDSDLHCTFAQFGHIQIQWPGKDIRSAIDGAAANKAGYVYIIFETYENVAALLASCTISYRDMDSGCRWYFNISSRRQKAKEVQVIPFDIGDRFYMKSTFSGQMEQSRTVFVGALHGMLSADGLAKVMDDLFGGVIFAGLDTDKFKYPLGSGRVIFDNQDSYLKSVSAAFVDIKSARFKKKIQIDPYVENESQCSVCKITQQDSVFCREEMQYFCQKCWQLHHSDPDSVKHRPIIKTKSNNP